MMTQAETELLLALFVLYGYECLHWLLPDEQAYTRTASGDVAATAGGWRVHLLSAQSFTMLGRRAVLADPLLIRPGFVRTPIDSGADAAKKEIASEAARKAVHKRLACVAEDLDDFRLLLTQCRIQAMLLLLVLPLLLWTHHLTPWWREFAGVLLFNHGLLCWWLIRALRVLPQAARRRVFAAALMNPLGATRVFDPLAQALFEWPAEARLQTNTPSPRGSKGSKV